jgi:hypothetical protein
MFAQSNELTMLTDLVSLQWKNRIIVVNETQNEEKVLALVEKHTAEINDRDIVWFIIKEDRTLTNYSGELSKDLFSSTRERYGAGQGKVILIGKDGGIKSRFDRVDLEAIFAEIDAMPMRQYEMQN